MCFTRVIDPSGPNNPDYLIYLKIILRCKNYLDIHLSCIYIVIGRVSVSQVIFCTIYIFTNSAPLGRVGHRVAMSVVVSVCAIAKHPLPEVV